MDKHTKGQLHAVFSGKPVAKVRTMEGSIKCVFYTRDKKRSHHVLYAGTTSLPQAVDNWIWATGGEVRVSPLFFNELAKLKMTG